MIAKSAGRVVETLNVAGMMKNRSLARAIADAGMAGVLNNLQYKCGLYGTDYFEADQWFASSKLCSRCGWCKEDLTLAQRQWRCEGCGVFNQQNANAARNLELWPGLRFPVTGRGDRVRPAMPAVVGEASMGSASEVRTTAYLQYQISSDLK